MKIELAQSADAEQILEIYKPIVDSTEISFELQSPSVDEMQKRIEETIEMLPWLVCRQNNLIVGYPTGQLPT